MRIETNRLVIRSFRPDDVDAYAQIVADPAVTRYLGDGQPHDAAEAGAYLDDVLVRDRTSGIARYAVEAREAGQLLGFCGFRVVDGYTDFGWRYARAVWGKGIGTEAALAVRDYGLALGLEDMAAGTYLANVASLNIIRRLGFPRCEHLHIQGQPAIRYYQAPAPA